MENLLFLNHLSPITTLISNNIESIEPISIQYFWQDPALQSYPEDETPPDFELSYLRAFYAVRRLTVFDNRAHVFKVSRFRVAIKFLDTI